MERCLVLPSNAPVLTQDHDAARKVFQATSGNLQSNIVKNEDIFSKDGRSSQTDLYNHIITTPSHEGRLSSSITSCPVSGTLIHQHSRRGHLSGARTIGRQCPLPRSWRYDPLLFPVETLSPKYREYREKAREREKKGVGIWTDRLEAAFQRAIRTIAPIGREKRTADRRQRGRNELIGDAINLWTGVQLIRKKVSSHIQVLRPFMMDDNPEWMSLVDSDLFRSMHHGRVPKSFYDKEMGALINMEPTIKSEVLEGGSGEYSLVCPDIIPSNFGLHDFKEDHPSKPTVRSIDFEMWIKSPTGDNKCPTKKSHIYTSMQTQIGSGSLSLEDLDGWRTAYPLLADLHTTEPKQITNCDLILLESDLSLMPTYPPCQSHLGISPFSVTFNYAADYSHWTHCSHFYNPLDPERPIHTSSKKLNSTSSASSSTTTIEVYFESKWWARLFSAMTERRLAAEATNISSVIASEQERTRANLRSITVAQEITARPPDAAQNDESKRMAILLWTFREARPGEVVATTAWRRLLPPPPRFVATSPSPPIASLQPPMTLDTTIHEGVVPQLDPLYAESFYQGMNYDEPTSLEGLQSPPPLLPPQPAISNGIHYSSFSSGMSSLSGTEMSQESALMSQEATSVYMSRNMSQDSTYGSLPSQLEHYTLQNSNVADDIEMEDSQADFTGGHIELQYEDLPAAYNMEVPYLVKVPQAVMVPSQQEVGCDGRRHWAAAYDAAMLMDGGFQEGSIENCVEYLEEIVDGQGQVLEEVETVEALRDDMVYH